MVFTTERKDKKVKYWIEYILSRIKKNKNFIGFISGATGSGKSYCSLRIAQELDSNFTIDNCVFSGLELMNLINGKTLKSGSVVVFEEIGVEMSNKNWQSVTNKMINYLFQTFRHRNFILIMNSPFMDFVDASTRKLFHAEFQTIGIDFKKKQAKLKPQLIQYNSRMQKFYYKRLKVITTDGAVPIDVWRVDKPSSALLKEYELKKKNYTDRLNIKITEELLALEGKQKKELSDKQTEVLDKLKEGLIPQQIAEELECHLSNVKSIMTNIKKKGYKLMPVTAQSNKAVYYEVTNPSRHTSVYIDTNASANKLN